jgi:hypothetical protein
MVLKEADPTKVILACASSDTNAFVGPGSLCARHARTGVRPGLHVTSLQLL